MKISTKYTWNNLLPYVRTLVLLAAMYLGLLYLIEYLTGTNLSTFKSMLYPFLFSLFTLYTGRRQRMTIEDASALEVYAPGILQEVQKMGYVEDSLNYYVPPNKKWLNYLQDRSIKVRIGSNSAVIEGPDKRILDLESILLFSDRFAGMRNP